MSSSRKICLIIHSLGIGGMERVMAQLARSFSNEQDARIDIILIGKNRENVYSLPGTVTIHRPPFRYEDFTRSGSAIRTIWYLRRQVSEINPDTILSFGEYWNNMVLLSLLGLNYPVFISDRSEPDKDLGYLQNMLRSFLYPRAAGYIAQTRKAQSVCIEKRWNSNVRVIANPIRNIGTSSESENEDIVLSVGRLIPTKHFDQLISMFLEIKKPGWKLVIVGGDAKKMYLSGSLEQLVHEKGAEDKVRLEGEQKNIDRYYQSSKIFAFTSSSEGFPNVIGEAMSAGLPVVAYDCVAGPSDMIQDGMNGYLIPLFDQTKFKEKLALLMENEAVRTRMSEAAAASVKRFSVSTVAENYYEFITGNTG
ncbi:MAG: glycosyltransferase family 4 protein [Balneolaceae bacterium]|nr:glycosyltransferase family 4 protein [Balneolaceae bacterium]